MILAKKENNSKATRVIKIGEHLVKVGAVSVEDIANALELQSETGDKIGKILQAEGKISSYKFYQEFAKFKNIEFINLDEQQHQKSLLTRDKRDLYFDYQFIPFAKDENGIISIATTDEEKDLHQILDQNYGEGNYKIFITSPYDILWTLQNNFADYDTEIAKNLLHRSSPNISSKHIVFSTKAKIVSAILLALTIITMIYSEQFFMKLVLGMNIFYLFTMISKILFFGIGIKARKEINHIHKSLPEIDNSELPIYSILVPIYKEKKKTLKKLLSSINNIDYPDSKLDIKLIVETDDFETVEIIKELKPKSNFQIIRVPYSEPRTKPKACNYALQYCTGEYVTIYDAEDIPDPQQLRRVLAVFNSSDQNLACVQARLNYFNRGENLLTGLFSIEYASWFDYMLYGLKKLDLPIPLGGTSNHFKINKLRALYAWDPYNVTEDADLGIRLSFANLKVEVIDSLTQEEAPISIKAWMMQRSRWIKGYIQTFFVHNKNPAKTIKKLGIKRFTGFVFFVGAPFIVFLTVPIMFVIMGIDFLMGSVLPAWLYAIALVNLYLGIAVHLFISAHVINNNKWYDNIIPAISFPFYWLLHYIASFYAVYELIKKPHHWNKTEHGLSIYTNIN